MKIHRDNATKESYADVKSNIPAGPLHYVIGNAMAHGVELEKHPEGIQCSRHDWNSDVVIRPDSSIEAVPKTPPTPEITPAYAKKPNYVLGNPFLFTSSILTRRATGEKHE